MSLRTPRLAGAAVVAALLTGCAASQPEPRSASCLPADRALPITVDAAGHAGVELRVMIYNVEGLPWPARKNRGPKLDEIGQELAKLRAAGRAPHIIMTQEAFTRRAGRIAEAAGYDFTQPGPDRKARRTLAAAEIDPEFMKGRRFGKGEKIGKRLGSGLNIWSDFPFVRSRAEPFSKNSCAGFDCISNKGALAAAIAIPGVPQPVLFITTHINSQGSSGVSPDRRDTAHAYQTAENGMFLEAVRASGEPMIFGGDFNMRGNRTRFSVFAETGPFQLVHKVCAQQIVPCDVKLSFDGDEPWMDTQDLQGYDDGSIVRIRPTRIEAMFDGGDLPMLADHDGQMVTYRLSWDPAKAGAAAPTLPGCTA